MRYEHRFDAEGLAAHLNTLTIIAKGCLRTVRERALDDHERFIDWAGTVIADPGGTLKKYVCQDGSVAVYVEDPEAGWYVAGYEVGPPLYDRGTADQSSGFLAAASDANLYVPSKGAGA